jgi:hypothetical protein
LPAIARFLSGTITNHDPCSSCLRNSATVSGGLDGRSLLPRLAD